MVDEVSLLDFWLSPFGLRVRLALALKGIKYEFIEEKNVKDDKSALLLKMNPVHKKIPVLIHNGKPICESLIIVQYIDEAWNDNDEYSLLPSDPYQRSQARFWADYIDKNIYGLGRKVWLGEGEGQVKAKKELIECLKVLEGELGEKTYFGGEALGFVDVALLPFYGRFYSYDQTCEKFSIEAECPKLLSWGKKCLENENVAKSLPDSQKVYEFALVMKKSFGVE